MFKFKKKKKTEYNLSDLEKRIASLEKKLEEISSSIKKIEEEKLPFIKKIGVVRYNPFSDAGGDHSFSIAILDEKENGVVITSLYGRNGNRTFAKPIEKGESTYSLSKEEKEAIKKAK